MLPLLGRRLAKAPWTPPVSKYFAKVCRQTRRGLASKHDGAPSKTCLYEFHKKHEGKLVDFAGFLMPIQYAGLSIVDSHLHTRRKASLFDVSHMLQSKIVGKDRVAFIESLTVADVQGLAANQSTLTLFTNEKGGVVDDLIVTNTSEDHLYVVSNAGCIEKDKKLLDAQLASFKAAGKDVHLEYLDAALIALQGPLAAKALATLVEYDLSKQAFMTTRLASVAGVEKCRITRCGYTGEDGFEISVPNERAEHISETLLNSLDGNNVQMAGLGARDTLRLEAGLCLYGNELDEKTTPVEAVLVWTIGKRRRALADFPGAEAILAQIKAKPHRKRVGLVALDGGPPARGGSRVLSADGGPDELVGVVTSGCPSPSLKKNICMAYVNSVSSKTGTRLICDVRGKRFAYEVVKMPFVPTNYFI